MEDLNPTKKQDGHSESERTRGGSYYRPRVDILENDQELKVLADMPGATRESIEIEFENGQLTIQGKVEPRRAGGEYLVQEYGIGSFLRTFTVGERIDVEQIRADYSDGVLCLTLPKSEAARPRKIAVHAG